MNGRNLSCLAEHLPSRPAHVATADGPGVSGYGWGHRHGEAGAKGAVLGCDEIVAWAVDSCDRILAHTEQSTRRGGSFPISPSDSEGRRRIDHRRTTHELAR